MKTIEIAICAIAPILFFFGCTSGRQTNPNTGNTRISESTQSKTLADESSLCNPHCEQVAYSYKTDPNKFRPLQLRAAEASSLKASLASTAVSANADTLHVHADAINGQLVFLPDSPTDPSRESHASTNEVLLRNPRASSSAVKVIPTPAALELLRQRETAAGPSR
jgi:hypothetical protein